MNALPSLLLSNAVVAGVLALLALGTWFVTRSAPLARALWLLVLLKLVTPPLLQLPMDWIPDGRGSPSQDSVLIIRPGDPGSTAPALVDGAPAVPPPALAHPPLDPSLLLLVIWGAGALTAAGLGCSRLRRCHALVSRTRAAGEDLQEQARDVAARLGLRRAPEVRLIKAQVSPFLWAMGRRPVIVLPTGALASLSPDETRAILAHELAHFVRRDHAVRWLEFLVLVVHWWNPLARWSCRRLREAEELCCDAHAVAALGTVRPYGGAILKVTEFLASSGSRIPMGATGFGDATLLKRRIQMLIKRPPSRLSRPLRIAMGLLAFALLPFGLRAQETPEEKPAKGKTTVIEIGEDGTITINGERLVPADGKGKNVLGIGRGSGVFDVTVSNEDKKSDERIRLFSGDRGQDHKVQVWAADVDGTRLRLLPIEGNRLSIDSLQSGQHTYVLGTTDEKGTLTLKTAPVDGQPLELEARHPFQVRLRSQSKDGEGRAPKLNLWRQSEKADDGGNAEVEDLKAKLAELRKRLRDLERKLGDNPLSR